MHSRIYLIGFMGSGKTTHGRKIARMMGYKFIDMDTWIEERVGKSVARIFSENGEPFFRRKETEAIRTLGKEVKTVIATGGGSPCQGNNIDLMKASGLVVYLKLSPVALLNNLKNSRTERPLLAGKSEEDMLQTITDLLAEREVYYNQAQMVIDGLHAADERVVNAIQRAK